MLERWWQQICQNYTQWVWLHFRCKSRIRKELQLKPGIMSNIFFNLHLQRNVVECITTGPTSNIVTQRNFVVASWKNVLKKSATSICNNDIVLRDNVWVRGYVRQCFSTMLFDNFLFIRPYLSKRYLMLHVPLSMTALFYKQCDWHVHCFLWILNICIIQGDMISSIEHS